MKGIAGVCVVVLGLGLVACGGGGGGAPSAGASTLPVVGEWLFTYPDTGCEERYQFESTGRFTASSLDERFGGVFTFDAGVSGARGELAISITDDNGLPDCQGSSEDNRGEHVVYTEFPSADSMRWYETEAGSDVAVTLTRQ